MKTLRLLLIFSILLLHAAGAYATTYYSRASANWKAVTTWSTVACGDVAAAAYPVAGDVVYICNGHTVATTAAAACATLIIKDGGALDVGAGATTITGTTTVGEGASGTLTISGATAKIFEGLVTINAGATWNNSGNIAVTFKGGITNSGTFTPGTAIQTFSINSQTLTGTFSIPSVTITGVTLTAAGNLTINTALVLNATAVLDMSTYTLAGTLSTLTIPAGGIVKTSSTANPPITSGKTWGVGGTVEFTKTDGGQSIPAGTYKNLTLDNSSNTNTAVGDIAVSGVFTTASGGTFDMGTYALSGAITTPVSNSGTLKTQNTSSAPITTGKSWGGTIEYNASSGSQTVMAGTYATLTLSNTSGTSTASGAITVTTLNTTASGTLDMSTFQLLTVTNVTNNGTIKTSYNSGTNDPIPTGKSWGGTIQYADAATSEVTAGTYNNLTILTAGGNVRTALGAITVNGTLTTTSGGTFDMSTFVLAGTFAPTNGGTLKTSCTTATSSTPIPTGLSWGGIVQYASASAQTVVTGTYNSLTLSGAATKTAGNTLTVNGTLTTNAAGDILDMSTYQLLGTLSTISNTGVIKTSYTSSDPIPTGKSWGGTVQYAPLTGGQSVSAGTYTTLTLLNTSGTNTASGAISVATTLTTTAGGTLDMATYALSGAATFTNNGTIKTQCLATPIPTGKSWAGTVNYNAATGGQTVMAGTYVNLTLGNTSGTSTASGAISVSTALTTTASGTLDMVTYALSGAMTPTNGGTIKTQCLVTPVTTGKSWGGTVEYNATTGGQAIMAGTYVNLTLSNTSGTSTASGAITISGALTTSSGGTFDMSTNAITASGTPTFTGNSGTLKTSKTGASILPTPYSWGGTVEYGGTAQSVLAGTYNNLTLSGSGAKAIPASTTVNAICSVQGTATVSTTAITYGASTTLEYKGSAAQTSTSYEFPGTSGPATLIINNSSGVILHAARSVSSLTMTSGTLTTTSTNLLTVTGTTTGAVSGGSSSCYISGPLCRTLPNNASAATYTYPIGKSAYQLLELVSTTTGGSGTGTITAEAFDADCGGTAGTGLKSLSTSRYWKLNSSLSSVTLDGGTDIRVTESGLSSDNTVAQSNSLAGTYNNLGGTLVSSTLLSTGTVDYSAMGTATYFTIGTLQKTYYSRATANWKATDTWSLASCGGATAGTAYPTAGDIVYICNGNTITTTATAACATLIVNNGGALTINNTIAVSGTTTIGEGASGTITLGTTGTKTFTGLVTVNTGATWDNSAAEAVTFEGGITNNGTFTAGTAVQTFDATTTLTGTLSIPSITITSATVTLAENAVLTVSTALKDATGTLTMGTNSTLNLGATSGNFTLGTLTATASGCTVDYNLGGAQAIRGTTYYNLKTSGTSGTKTLDNTTTVNGKLTIGSGTTIADAGYTITVKGDLENNGTESSNGTGKIKLNGGSGVHAISGSTCSFKYLELDDSNGATFTGTGTTTVSGELTVTTGTLTCNGFTTGLSVTGTTHVDGTLTIANATGTHSFTGLVTVDGTWNNSANEDIAFAGGLTNNGTFTSGSGTYTFSNTKTITGTVSISNVAITGIITNTNTLTVGTALSGAGTLKLDANSTLKIGGTISTLTLNANTYTPNTVEYTATGGGQTIYVPFTTYYDLKLSNTGGTNTAGGTLTINNNFTTTSGGTFADGGYTITVKGNVVMAGTHSGAGSITLTSNSSTTHNLSGGGTFQNLILNDVTYGATLTGNISVAGTLTLTNGTITLGSNDLSLTTATEISGYTSAKYIITNSTGMLKRTIGSASTYVFPIGSATAYNPVSVTWSAAPGITRLDALYTATTASGTTGLPITYGDLSVNTLLDNGYWTLTKTGTLSNNYSITLTRNGHTNAGSNLLGHGIVKRADAGSAWESAGTRTTPSNTAKGATDEISITHTGISSFSQYDIGKGCVGGTASCSPDPPCDGSATTLSLSGSSGSVQWQQSTDGGANWSNISGATSSSSNSGTLTRPTSYSFRAWIDGGTCNSTTKTMGQPQLNDVSSAYAGAAGYACNGSYTLAATTPSHGTGAWTVYSGTGSFSDVSSPTATVSSLTGGINNLIWTVTDGSCSTDDTVSVIEGGYNISASSSCIFSDATVDLDIDNYTGTLQWQERESTDAGANWTSWADIGGATSTPYTTGTLSTANQYEFRAKITSGACTDYSDVLTVNDDYCATTCAICTEETCGTSTADCTWEDDGTDPDPDYTLNSGQKLCITGGTYSGAITFTSSGTGGSIIVKSGATFNPSSISGCSSVSGAILIEVQEGGAATLPAFSLSSCSSVTINNCSSLTLGTITVSSTTITINNNSGATLTLNGNQNSSSCAYTLNNAGTVSGGGYDFTFSSSSMFCNSGTMTLNNINMSSCSGPNNSGTITLNGNLSMSSSSMNICPNSEFNVNGTITASSSTITGMDRCGEINTTGGATMSSMTLVNFNICDATGAGNNPPVGSCSSCTLPNMTYCTCSELPLPIELLYFKGENKNGVVLLYWATATEINNDYFTVERSVDAINFEFLAKVKGAGNSNTPISYTEVDNFPPAGTVYYRLKQTDFDGKYSYSNIIAVKINDKIKTLGMTQPYFDGAVINTTATNIDSSILKVEIIDYTGALLFYNTFETNKEKSIALRIPAYNLVPNAVYLMRITNGKESVVKRFTF